MIRLSPSWLLPAVVATALSVSPATAAPPSGHARGYSGAFHADPIHSGTHYSAPHYYSNYGFHPNNGFRPRTFIWYGGSPYYGYSYPSYGYSPYPVYGSGYFADPAPTDSSYYGAGIAPYTAGWMTPAADSGAPPVQAESIASSGSASTDAAAKITVRLPAGAELWIDGNLRGETGAVREFTTPMLSAGRQYTYEVHARWTEGDTTIDQTKKVVFGAGDKLDMTFPIPPATGAGEKPAP